MNLKTLYSLLKSKTNRNMHNLNDENHFDSLGHFGNYKIGNLQSALIIDDPNYPKELEKLIKKKKVSEFEADRLLQFHHDGFCTLNLDEPDTFYDELMFELEEVWKESPKDLLGSGAYVPGGKLMPLNSLRPVSDPSNYRSPGSRIIDVHSHSNCAEKLYLNPKIHRLIDLILEQKCVATQSLYFEYGSQQALHRDPWFVVTKPKYNLVACWIALEDIYIDSGPLSYIRGSHRWPFLYDQVDNIILHAQSANEEYKSLVYQHLESLIKTEDKAPEKFLAKKGEVFIWHGALVHGGTPVADCSLTRKSLVIHFDAKATAAKRGSRFILDGKERVNYSDTLLCSGDSFGFKNPYRGGKRSFIDTKLRPSIKQN